jgi:hypothetical protein
MNRNPVTSSVLASVGYDPMTWILELEFHSGRVYEYYNIPQKVYTDLLSAPSHGRFFCHNIRGQGYCERVE